MLDKTRQNSFKIRLDSSNLGPLKSSKSHLDYFNILLWLIVLISLRQDRWVRERNQIFDSIPNGALNLTFISSKVPVKLRRRNWTKFQKSGNFWSFNQILSSYSNLASQIQILSSYFNLVSQIQISNLEWAKLAQKNESITIRLECVTKFLPSFFHCEKLQIETGRKGVFRC